MSQSVKWGVVLCVILLVVWAFLSAPSALPKTLIDDKVDHFLVFVFLALVVQSVLSLLRTAAALLVFGTFIRHSPDSLRVRGNRTTVPPSRERDHFRGHPMT